jgi:endonuclease/exonuclease/phosphatase family metal-dependent hydrolase
MPSDHEPPRPTGGRPEVPVPTIRGEPLIRRVGAGRLLTGVAAAAVALAPAVPQPVASAGVSSPDVAAVWYGAVLAPGHRPGAGVPGVSPFGILQVNLCDSGLARCYANGQSVPEAAAVVRAQRPDVLTLNEFCRGDGGRGLVQAMEQTWPGDRVFEAFYPAGNSSRNAPYLCRSGQQYGVAVIGHVAPANWAGLDVRGGVYPIQNASSSEQRVWLCAYAIGSYYVCTTHLDADAAGVAAAQCRYLMNTAIPNARAAMGGYSPTVVGGDLNLRYGGHPNVQSCVPAGWFRKGDDDVQHILATSDLTFQFARRIGMRHTDHDAWLVAVRAPAARRPAGGVTESTTGLGTRPASAHTVGG